MIEVPFGFDRQQMLDMIEGVAEQAADAPEELPPKPHGYLSRRELEEHPESDGALATKRWQLHASDVRFRNRRRLQSLLWSCRVLRDLFGDSPEFKRLGTPLTLQLISFGWRGDVPADHAGIIAAVRDWHPSHARARSAA
jgi:hypothetical protein